MFFNSTFDFKANSTLYDDEGSGAIANMMTATLAVSPSYCNVTGKLEAKYNSIVVQIPDMDAYAFNLTAKTFPMMQLRETLE